QTPLLTTTRICEGERRNPPVRPCTVSLCNPSCPLADRIATGVSTKVSHRVQSQILAVLISSRSLAEPGNEKGQDAGPTWLISCTAAQFSIFSRLKLDGASRPTYNLLYSGTPRGVERALIQSG